MNQPEIWWDQLLLVMRVLNTFLSELSFKFVMRINRIISMEGAAARRCRRLFARNVRRKLQGIDSRGQSPPLSHPATGRPAGELM
jgi:hypothetical protein